MTTIKLKNGSGAPTAGDLVQGEPALDLTNKRLYTEDSGGTVIEVGTNPGTDVTFADNRKAIFGAGSDLQIYHDGSNSYIDDAGTGNLFVRASDNFYVQNSAGTETKAAFTTDGAVTLYYNGGTKFQTVAGGIDVTGSISADGLTVDTNTLHVDATNNRVGIGTSSPSEQLDVQLNAIVNESGAGDKGLFVGPSGFAGSFVYKSSGDAEIAPRSGKNLLFAASTGGSERMRIDSSGNLLVSKTSNDNSTAGVVLRDTGEGSFVVSAGRSGLFNRLSSDGEIINFRKDNTTVGSIASRAGVVTTIVLNPASGNGAGLSGGTKAVVPADEAGIVDNDISLGVSTHRFKDLHLSGGAYLGGTAAANLLDSYEEGTWIPTVVGATTAGSFTYASQVGKYVKVGNAVHIEASIEVSATATSASGVITVNGLPFNKSNNGGFSSITIGWAENVTFAHDQLGAYIVSNQTKINLRHIDSAGGGGFVQGSELGSTFFIFVSGWYSNS